MSIIATDTDLPPTETKQPVSKSQLRPRRTLNRLAWALVGVALAILGQIAFDRESLWEGILFYGLAVVLFVRTLVDRPYPNSKFANPDPHLTNILTICRGWRRLVGVWVMVLGTGISVLGYSFFENPDAQIQAWWVYWVSIGLFIVGALLLTPGSSPRAELRRLIPSRQIAIGLSIVIGLALFMRLYDFYSQPFGIWFDEAEAGLQARRILNEPDYRPILYPTINITGHLLTIYALALQWLGDNIHALRLVSVSFGVAGVLAAYLFGQAVRGPRFGLALAFLIAVARWHVNFSRIAMTGIDTPFFEFLSLFFLVRLVKHRRLRDALWAGLTTGAGLMFYTAFRLYVLALVTFTLVVIIRWWPQVSEAMKTGGWRRYLGALAILAVSSWLVVMPLVKFALDNPEAFWYRTQQISILTKRDQADLGKALWQNTHQHLLMFNYKGDRNGRHNLPGEPMVDPGMGILLVLGFGLAIARTRQPANTFFLILFPLAILGGIFTLDFEAPQSLRSIAVMPAIIYFAGLAVVALGREVEKAFQPLPPIWVIAPTVVVAGYIFLSNAHTYFVRQANDFASWNAFSAPETITGRKMAELGPEYVYILSPFLANHPTTHFLAPSISNQQILTVPDALPVRDPTGRPVAMFIHPDDAWIFNKAKQIYPNANFEIFSGPSSQIGEAGAPSVYFAGLEVANLMAVRGLELRYWPINRAEEAQQLTPPLQANRALNVNVTWPQDGPMEADFIAEWDGIIYIPRFGSYNFKLITPGSGLLELDGNAILDGQGEQLTNISMAQGNHRIRIQAEAAPGQVALFWQPPGQGEELVPTWALYAAPITNHGLQGTFYANNDWQGQPAFQRIDPFLDTYFHLIPLQRPYSVEWTGSLVVPQSGVYRLGLRVVQEAELFLDQQLLLTTTGPDQYTEVPIPLEAGLHEILIRYRDTVDRSRVHLSWTKPDGTTEPIPSEYLWPPMGSYPEQIDLTQSNIEIRPITLRYLTSLGQPGNQPGQFLEPRDIAVLSNGHLVVADTGNRRVQIFNSQLKPLHELTGDEFPFEEPLAVGINRNDEILVLDSSLQWVYRYNATGTFINRFGGPNAHLFHPRGLTVFEDNSLALADTGTARLTFFNPNGDQINNIGGLGNGPGQLNEPTDVLRDNLGTYFVVEAENNRLQRLDAGGNPLNQWTIPPAYAYNGPHLTFGPDGSILMTEAQSDALLHYSPTGELLDQWHTIDSVTLVDPVGIYFDRATNRLYVTDVGTHQVHIFFVEITNG